MSQRDGEEKPLSPTVKDAETVDHTPVRRSSVSRGLQIRCPFCSGSVEILVDTPYEEVCCSSCGSSFSLVSREEATREAPALRTIGRFELVSRLGFGGFGAVWKARDAELDRLVAIKIPRKGRLAPAEIEQFFREARAAAQLRHPHIVPVHEVGREGDALYIVSDFIRGVDLGDWLTGRSLSFVEVARLCRKIASALHHAHEAGIVHRDLKPSNVLIDESDEPHLTDFGLAKREAGEITMTVDGQILGTPAYMSPEQAGGKAHWTDRRSDLYSLGVLMFRLLTGELPFRGNAQMQVHQRLTEDAPDPRKLNRQIPKDLSTVCLKCLERDPNRRYPTGLAVIEELDRYIAGIPIQARPLSRLLRLARWAERKPSAASAAALVLFLAVAGPLTAYLIDRQRVRLEQLVMEKNALIDRGAGEKQRDAAEIASLQQELAIWTGKSNPYSLWPPHASEPPRERLLTSLYRERYDATLAELRNGVHDDWEQACGRLAVAMLAVATGHDNDALPHLAAAQETLQRLSAERPDEQAYRAVHARCCGWLARLHERARPPEAQRWRAEASRLYEQLVDRSDGMLSDGGPSQEEFRIERFETLMQSAAAAGFDDASPRLDLAAQLERQISASWPQDLVALYRLVCFLSGEDSPPAANAD